MKSISDIILQLKLGIWEFGEVVATRADCLREWALISDPAIKRWRVVAYEHF